MPAADWPLLAMLAFDLGIWAAALVLGWRFLRG